MPANSHEQVSGGRFEEIPAPAGARPGSQWFACEPSESWGTWIGDGTAEFFLDSLEGYKLLDAGSEFNLGIVFRWTRESES